MAAKFSDLVKYFEFLATQYKGILHRTEEKHFYRFELDEVLTAMCGDMHYPALILEGYTIDYEDNVSDNIMKSREGAFILIGHVDDIKDYDAIHALYDELEGMGDDLLMRIRRDKQKRAVPVVRDFDFGAVSAQLLDVRELGQFGVRFSFIIGSAMNSDIDEKKWL